MLASLANVPKLVGSIMKKSVYGKNPKILPSDIYGALENFEKSKFMSEILGERNKDVFAQLKRKTADRSPRYLGVKIKGGEILFHHEVTNQMLWNNY